MTDFTLRPWREADAASIARYADNAKIAANLRDVFPCPYAPQDAATFVESCIRQEGRGQMCRAIEVDGEAAGSIGLFLGSDVYRRSAELGYWLGEPFWGRGIMTEIDYVVDCVYRFCSFSGGTYQPRSYQQFLDDNMGSKK